MVPIAVYARLRGDGVVYIRTSIYALGSNYIGRLQYVNGSNVHQGGLSWASVTWNEAGAPTYDTFIDNSFGTGKSSNSSAGIADLLLQMYTEKVYGTYFGQFCYCMNISIPFNAISVKGMIRAHTSLKMKADFAHLFFNVELSLMILHMIIPDLHNYKLVIHRWSMYAKVHVHFCMCIKIS